MDRLFALRAELAHRHPFQNRYSETGLVAHRHWRWRAHNTKRFHKPRSGLENRGFYRWTWISDCPSIFQRSIQPWKLQSSFLGPVASNKSIRHILVLASCFETADEQPWSGVNRRNSADARYWARLFLGRPLEALHARSHGSGRVPLPLLQELHCYLWLQLEREAAQFEVLLCQGSQSSSLRQIERVRWSARSARRSIFAKKIAQWLPTPPKEWTGVQSK